jgi:hypothetical protein
VADLQQTSIDLLDLADLAEQLDFGGREQHLSDLFNGRGSAARVAAPPPPAARPCLSSVTNLTAVTHLNIGCRLQWAENGGHAKLVIPGREGGTGGGTRQPVTEFSSKAARALLAAINSVDRVAAPADQWWFPLLTYPQSFPPPRVAKDHLHDFTKRLRRRWDALAGVWKMEPQQRLAPHFHCLLRIPPGIEPIAVHAWWCHAWYEIAGGGDLRHLVFHMDARAFQRMRTWDGVGSYAAKYMGKRIPDQGWEKPGRLWGRINWDAMPVREIEVSLSRAEAVRVKRGLLRWLDHQRTGRYRVERLRGRIERVYLHRREIELMEANEVLMRPYHRRRRRRSTGGCELLVPASVTEQLLGHALGDVPLSRFADAFEYLGGGG